MRRLTDRVSAARRNDGGFTLIELLIVIVILGVLAAIVVFGVRGITDRGKTAACKADKHTVEVAAEAGYAQDSAYYSVADLVLKNYLREAPPASEGIAVDTTSGVVSATGC
jgi:general secretion pathway protein G